MRELASATNTIEINDGLSGDVHEMHYRRPTAQEMAAYQASLFERKGKKVKNRVYETRIEFGAKILTGFKVGTFGYDGQAISANKADKTYREDWQRILKELAPDVVAAVAQQVFEGTGVSRGMDDIEYDTEIEGGSPL